MTEMTEMKKYIFEWGGHKFYDVAGLVEYIINNTSPRELCKLVEDGYYWLKHVRDERDFNEIIILCLLSRNGRYHFIWNLTCNMLHEVITTDDKVCSVNELTVRQVIDLRKIPEVEE